LACRELKEHLAKLGQRELKENKDLRDQLDQQDQQDKEVKLVSQVPWDQVGHEGQQAKEVTVVIKALQEVQGQLESKVQLDQLVQQAHLGLVVKQAMLEIEVLKEKLVLLAVLDLRDRLVKEDSLG
jgi:hypothetical protein